MQDKADNTRYVRALVVDDSLTVRRLMDLTLSPLGIDLEFADNGEDAIPLPWSWAKTIATMTLFFWMSSCREWMDSMSASPSRGITKPGMFQSLC